MTRFENGLALFDLEKGRYRARQAQDAGDMQAAVNLRAACFGAGGAIPDPYDSAAFHVLIHDIATGRLVCCYRLRTLRAEQLDQSYAARFYGLGGMSGYHGLMLELGRFCIDPDMHDGDILRMAWAVLTRFVDDHDVQMLFGCSSFVGTDPAKYLDAFALLRARYLGHGDMRPVVKAPEVFLFNNLAQEKPDLKAAQAALPSLLRTYLTMGGWVSDHAVIDRQLNTLHVFTALEIGAIPDTRKRLLRAMVQ